MQGIGRIFLVLEALGESAVGAIDLVQFGAQPNGLGAKGFEFFVLRRDGRHFPAERACFEGVGDLGGGQGEAVEAGLFEFAPEEGVAAAGVATSEEQARLAGREGVQAGLLVGGSVGGAVGLAVAVERDTSVGLIDDCQMDEFAGLGGLGRAVYVLGTDRIVTASHPLRLLLFAEDDRVEHPAAYRFYGQDAAAPLVEGGQGDPGFEGLGGEGLRGRAGLGEGFPSIEQQSPVLDDGASQEFGVELADEVASVLFEGPPVAGRRSGILVRLETTAEFIGGECAFDLHQLVLKTRTFLGGGADTFEGRGEIFGLLDPLGREFGADGLLELGQAIAVPVEQGGGIDGHLARAGGGEDAVEGCEVGLADGVELMVVATGAGHREAQERLADHVDLVVHVADLLVDGVDRLIAMFDHAEVAGAYGRLIELFRFVEARGLQQVAGELFADELVVRDVGIEGADEVIAVAPSLWDGGIAFAAVRVGVADEVHPVTGEVFAVARRGQQAVDDFGEGFRRLVGFERGDLRGGGGQAREHIGSATEERGLVGRCGGSDAGGGDLRVEEAVDRARGLAGRNGGGGDRLEAPPVLADLQEVGPSGGDGVLGGFHARVGGSAINPFREVGDDLRVQFRALLRHHQGLMAVLHGQDEEALLRVTGDDGRTFFAALEQAVTVIEAKVAFLFLGVMAFIALRDQHRPDLRFEELDVRRLQVGGQGTGQGKTEPGQDAEGRGQGGGVSRR